MPLAKTPATTFGVELEFGVRDSEAMRDIRSDLESVLDGSMYELGSDGSVRYSENESGYGCELRSVGGHDIEALLKALKPILKIVREYELKKKVKVNSSAGLHVHVGIAEWKLSDIRSFYRSFVKSLDSWLAFQPRSRWINTYCKNNNESNSCSDNFWQAFRNHDRYYMVNLQSIMSHETVELRLFAGTVCWFKVERTLRIVNAFIKSALLNKDKDVELFEAIDNKKLLQFLQSRIKKCHKGSSATRIRIASQKINEKLNQPE